MAERELTPKQAAFALAYFETANATEAYRRAYDVDPNARDMWISVEACQLLDHPKVALKLQELHEQAAKLSIYTRQKAMEELEEARREAKTQGQISAMVSAVNSKVKLTGLDRPHRVEVSGKDGGPIKTEVSARDIIAGKLARLAPSDGDAGGSDGADG